MAEVGALCDVAGVRWVWVVAGAGGVPVLVGMLGTADWQADVARRRYVVEILAREAVEGFTYV